MDDEYKTREQLKYYAARFAYIHRKEFCPKKVQQGRHLVEITWEQWFRDKFGEDLDAYVYRLREASEAQRDQMAQSPAPTASGSEQAA